MLGTVSKSYIDVTILKTSVVNALYIGEQS